MLELDERGRPQLVLGHLHDEIPLDFNQVIERYTTLDGALFHHVISSPTCRYESRFGKGRVPDEIAKMSALDRFKNILRSRHIIGNPKSYFVNKHKASLNAAQIEGIKSVSFAFCRHDEVKKHFEARGSEYGICFYHDFLQDRGMRPVVYLRNL